ncbi:MAG: DUF1156 domain-containing protein, partial [Candidatus Competibacteraceae bacterium]
MTRTRDDRRDDAEGGLCRSDRSKMNHQRTGKSFIEVQFPIKPLSIECYKERRVSHGKALTLGKWWGEKPSPRFPPVLSSGDHGDQSALERVSARPGATGHRCRTLSWMTGSR